MFNSADLEIVVKIALAVFICATLLMFKYIFKESTPPDISWS